MSTRRLVRIALFVAIMFIVTAFIAIPIGSFGYINLSDFLIMILAPSFDLLSLVLISALGTSLSDLFLGFSSYALFTFTIKGLEAFLIYKLLKRHFKPWQAFSLGAFLMLIGYGISDIILTFNFKMFAASFMANFPQAFICVILALLLYKPFKKLEARYF